jgi:hypothetical protein
MKKRKHPGCASCALRKRAEARPRSLVGILWKLHTHVCPGWKAYQRSLGRAVSGR